MFPPDILAEAPVTIEDMKNGTYGNNKPSHRKVAKQEKALPILHFLMVQYRQSKTRPADELDEKHFSHSRAWLEFCSRQTGDCLIANIFSRLEWCIVRTVLPIPTPAAWRHNRNLRVG